VARTCAGLDANVVHVGRLARRSARLSERRREFGPHQEFGDVDSVVQLTARDLDDGASATTCNNVTSSSSAIVSAKSASRRARRAAPRPACTKVTIGWPRRVALDVLVERFWSFVDFENGLMIEEGEESQHRRRRDVIGVQEELVHRRTRRHRGVQPHVLVSASDLPNFCPSAQSNGVVTPSAW